MSANAFLGVCLTGALLGLWHLRTYRELRHTRQRLQTAEHAAHHDALTGLPNRRLFDARLERACDSGTPIALALLDLDRFKQVNDQYGYGTGDQVLAATGAKLRQLPDVVLLAARLGGDEFVLLISGEPDTALLTAKHVWQILATPAHHDHGQRPLPHTPASIGVAVRHHHTTPSQLMRWADLALHHAKHTGCGVHLYTSGSPEATARPAHRTREHRTLPPPAAE